MRFVCVSNTATTTAFMGTHMEWLSGFVRVDNVGEQRRKYLDAACEVGGFLGNVQGVLEVVLLTRQV